MLARLSLGVPCLWVLPATLPARGHRSSRGAGHLWLNFVVIKRAKFREKGVLWSREGCSRHKRRGRLWVGVRNGPLAGASRGFPPAPSPTWCRSLISQLLLSALGVFCSAGSQRRAKQTLSCSGRKAVTQTAAGLVSLLAGEIELCIFNAPTVWQVGLQFNFSSLCENKNICNGQARKLPRTGEAQAIFLLLSNLFGPAGNAWLRVKHSAFLRWS